MQGVERVGERCVECWPRSTLELTVPVIIHNPVRERGWDEGMLLTRLHTPLGIYLKLIPDGGRGIFFMAVATIKSPLHVIL